MGIEYCIIVAIVFMIVGIVNQEFYRNHDNMSIVFDYHIIGYHVIVVSIAICILIIIVF